jgi:hypothetical protein
MDQPYEHPLDRLPDDAILRSVTAEASIVDGRSCLRVELEDEVTRDGVPYVHYIDQSTFVDLPIEMMTGRIEVDVMAQLNGKTDFDSRGFAGIAYRIDDEHHFEGIYVRSLNGVHTDSPLPRKQRGIQYFAHPDWLFDRLRDEHPAEYEGPADVRPGEWCRLAIELTAGGATAFIDDQKTLTVTNPKAPLRSGRTGLFVDIGTEAYFANLRVTRHS